MRDDCSLIAWIHEIIDGYKQNHLPDTAMSDQSENPVQNKVIKKYVDEKEVKISKEKANAIIKYGDGLYVQDKAEQLSNMQSVFENTVASVFSEEKDYHVGEYVVHENRLYRFTGEKSAGPWDSGKAVEGSLMSEVNAIRDKTDLLQGSQGDYSVSVSKELQQLHQIDEENQYLHDHVEFNDYSGVDSVPPPEQSIEQITSGKSIKMLHQLTKVSLKGLLELAQRALAVALGKNQAKVFDTVEDLDNWLKVPANLNTLSVGDHFYIKETEVPDYWWDGTQKQELETQKVDLTPYDKSVADLQAKDAELTTSLNTHTHDDRYYTETEMETKLSGKSNTGHAHAWGEITGKPESFTPSTHNHDERYYTETEMDGKLDLKSDEGHDHAWEEITGKPTTFPPDAHNHDDRYYTETEMMNLLNGKANTVHSHDDQYYTQGQMDTFLLEKSDVDHEHDWDSILGKPETIPPSEHDHDSLYYRKSEVDDALAGKSASYHDHDDRYYTESEISNLLSNKANASHTHNYAASIHTHDDRYYTESEVNNKLAAKAEAEHTHVWADLTDKPTSFTPSSHTHDDRYYTESEINTKLDGKSNTNHTHSYAATSHTHDDRYYTESEMNTKLDGKSNTSHTHSGYATSSHTHATITGYVTTGKKDGTTVGSWSTAEGWGTTVTNQCSHGEGWSCTATGNSSHAEGKNTTASGDWSHAEGQGTKAAAPEAHSEGYNTQANANSSHAGGSGAIANGTISYAHGDNVIASTWGQTAIGRFNVKDTNASNALSHWLIIGNGTSDTARSNAFRVDVGGTTYAKGAYNTSGADYAEYFEWLDKNKDSEDRRGYFVTLEGNKIRKATSTDNYILGVVSSMPVVVGNSDPDDWHDRFLHDEFGNYVMEQIEDKFVIDGVEHTRLVDSYVVNPDFDPEKPYTPRAKRPEWAPIGMLGQLIVHDDGTCKINGYCKANDDGVAVSSATGYRVIERVNDALIKIIFK